MHIHNFLGKLKTKRKFSDLAPDASIADLIKLLYYLVKTNKYTSKLNKKNYLLKISLGGWECKHLIADNLNGLDVNDEMKIIKL